MDFFTEQDRAKGKTGRLVILFVLAIASIVGCVYSVVVFAFYYLGRSRHAVQAASEFHYFDPGLFALVAALTLVVILIGSVYKVIGLRSGGSYVAESLGGSLVSPGTSDPLERRFLNVLEEMAIASGVPVPQGYLLPSENGINAFAAGYSPNDAVVAVTRGCLQELNREELQGVVAHEFSHILNGDMRLNIRLIGLLGGILVISNIGYLILRTTTGGSRKGGQIAILGIGFLAIGYLGVLVGRLIQSSISRQREYLADASAVQFTRNPTGIGNALKRIGGFHLGSAVRSPAAGEACHMFFMKGVSSLFATHPPLVDRIRRIDPSFSGEFKELPAAGKASLADEAPGVSALHANPPVHASASSVINRVGKVSRENVAFSEALIAGVPERVRDEIQDILGASAVVCALLLDRDAEEKQKQLLLLQKSAPLEMVRHIMKLEGLLAGLNPRLKLPLLDMAVPALRLMSRDQYERLMSYIDILVQADQKITLFEFSFKEVIQHQLHETFNPARRKVVHKDITPLIPDTVLLLSALARVGAKDEAEAQQAFKTAMADLPVRKVELTLSEARAISLQTLHAALDRFASASPGVKKVVFDACTKCVFFDENVSAQEAELLRAIAHAMDIPLPPFL